MDRMLKDSHFHLSNNNNSSTSDALNIYICFLELPSFLIPAIGMDIYTFHYTPLYIQQITKDPLWRRKWQPTPEFLPGKFHGQKSLVGYSSWHCKESDMTSCLHTHTHTHTHTDTHTDLLFSTGNSTQYCSGLYGKRI